MNKDIEQHLLQKGWAISDDLLPRDLTDSLLDLAITSQQENSFGKAKIGRAFKKELNPEIRTDEIMWIDQWNSHLALLEYLSFIKNLAKDISRSFFLPLKSFEGHFAHYAPGDFYLKHLDQHSQTKHRQVSIVTYLNEGKGGELTLFESEKSSKVLEVISPKPGRVVIFFSSQIYHQVEKSQFDRFSLTGWMRDDPSLFTNRPLLE